MEFARVDEFFFAAQAGEDSKIDILGEARLSPFLNGDSADEAIFPTPAIEK
ncbi:MAG: hypothetical protein JO353_00410 [Phycisphaerae bacterium]|nr:hypothetical protein [Phycisphaerae bacterium]